MKFATLAALLLFCGLANFANAARFIVTLKPGVNLNSHVASMRFNHRLFNIARRFANRAAKVVSSNLEIKRQFSALASNGFHGYVVDTDSLFAQIIRGSSSILFMEPDTVMRAYDVQESPTNWGLDRIDQRTRVLDNKYNFQAANLSAVSVYVIDTGVKITHREFEGRAEMIKSYYESSEDQNSHGTHVAGIIAGRSTGVAKTVQIKGIKVLDAQGSGYNSDIIDGINFAVQHARNSGKRGIINLSLGGFRSSALNAAINAAFSAGLIPVVAAGNENTDAFWSSPASASNALAVGASTNGDSKASFSNHGSLVRIHAPGVNILSASIAGDDQYVAYSGTSMATPLVSGAVAILWGRNPSASPSAIVNELINLSTKSTLTGLRWRTPNRLLYIN